MKKLLFIAVVASSLGIVNCMDKQLQSQKSADTESQTHDVNYRNLPVQIAAHLAQANELLETGNATQEQLHSLAKNHFMLAYALSETPDLPRPQLLYKMSYAEFSIMSMANLESMCLVPDLALESIRVMMDANVVLMAIGSKASYALRKKIAPMVALSNSKIMLVMDGVETFCNNSCNCSKCDQLIDSIEKYAYERFRGWDSALSDSAEDYVDDQDGEQSGGIPTEAALFMANAHFVYTKKCFKESDDAQLRSLPRLLAMRIQMVDKFSSYDVFSKAELLSLLAEAHYTTLDALSKKPEPFRTKLLQSVQPMMDEIQAILDAYKVPNPFAE
ncbi:hypothetical protein FACS1894122_12670 [Alphaproteobacteria bacterium]|nr:hypothetical protein FACS1894122_12670 [Alphaproteobacteria bacterium]